VALAAVGVGVPPAADQKLVKVVAPVVLVVRVPVLVRMRRTLLQFSKPAQRAAKLSI
jgi:hypothetical protein